MVYNVIQILAHFGIFGIFSEGSCCKRGAINVWLIL